MSLIHFHVLCWCTGYSILFVSDRLQMWLQALTMLCNNLGKFFTHAPTHTHTRTRLLLLMSDVAGRQLSNTYILSSVKSFLHWQYFYTVTSAAAAVADAYNDDDDDSDDDADVCLGSRIGRSVHASQLCQTLCLPTTVRNIQSLCLCFCVSLYLCVCLRAHVCVCVCVCRYTNAGHQDVCVTGRRLEMTDFDAALDLLHESQSDVLGAPKVSHSVITTACSFVTIRIIVCVSVCQSVYLWVCVPVW